MKNFNLIILVVSLIALGYDYFLFVYFKGLMFSPINVQQISLKFILSASLHYFLIIRLILILLPSIVIIFVLLLKIKLNIFNWFSLFVKMFYGLYFLTYVLPKTKRLYQWDIKNPIRKWKELYNNYLIATEILLLISLVNAILALIVMIYF